MLQNALSVLHNPTRVLFFELTGIQLVIRAAGIHQRFMRAAFHNLAVVDHQKDVYKRQSLKKIAAKPL